jgi:DNA-directed RNA polymerase specialized sigma24 family protein
MLGRDMTHDNERDNALIIELKDGMGMSFSKIAAEMQTSKQNAWQRYHRAKARQHQHNNKGVTK